MKRARLLAASAALACSTLFSSTLGATLYFWNPAKRPPISLTAAIALAEKSLGDDAKNRYCIDAFLWGDKTREGKEGTWNLLFAAEDGSAKHVSVSMHGQAGGFPLRESTEKKQEEDRRESLEDIRKRLAELFEDEGVRAKFQLQDSVLLVTADVREFQIYPLLEA